jgi:hypothetical protein
MAKKNPAAAKKRTEKQGELRARKLAEARWTKGKKKDAIPKS